MQGLHWLHFGNNILHLLFFNTTLQFKVSGIHRYTIFKPSSQYLPNTIYNVQRPLPFLRFSLVLRSWLTLKQLLKYAPQDTMTARVEKKHNLCQNHEPLLKVYELMPALWTGTLLQMCLSLIKLKNCNWCIHCCKATNIVTNIFITCHRHSRILLLD